MTALVLGLLVASAKTYYDTQSTELTELAAKVVLLDRILAHYGPEARESRDLLRAAVGRVVEQTWSKDGSKAAPLEQPSIANEIIYDRIQALAPQDDAHRSIQAQAMNVALAMGQTRWLMFAQSAISVSTPLLITLIAWLGITFLSFGVLAPRNGTVIGSLFAAAVSVAAAVFLILELYSPFTGVVRISGAPLRAALARLGQ
jgi:hypothetical protein